MGLGRLLTTSRPERADDHVRNAGDAFQMILDASPIFPASIYRGVMAVPGAFRASLLLSDLLGQVPWYASRTRAGVSRERLDPTPLLLEQPAPPDTRMTTFSSLALDLIHHGNAFGIIASRNRDGYPTGIVPIPAEQVGVRWVSLKAWPLPQGPIEYNVAGYTFTPNDVIHIKGPCPPGWLRGFGVLEAHLNGTIALAMEQARQAGNIAQHGVPTGVLKSANPDLTAAEATDLKAKWLNAQRDRSVAVLNPTTEFQPLSWNPEQMQLVEARRFTMTDLEHIYGLPVGWLGGMNSARQYSNIEQDAVNLLKFSLGGHLARFEQTFSLALPRGTEALADLDSILRADTLTRFQAHALALANRFMTVDEVREVEGRPPLPEQAQAAPIEGDQTNDQGTTEEAPA